MSSEIKVKRVPARVLKAAGQAGADTLQPGQFEAIVSVFGNVDLYGDVMMPGAFQANLVAWEASGNPIPVIWSHDWQDPDSHIGYVLEAREVGAAAFGPTSPAGLYVKGQNDVGDNARAAQVQRLMTGGRITQFSFAYSETNAGWGVYGGEEAWLINACDVHEVGPTLLGANPDTTLIGAKRTIIDLAARTKDGARHSTADMKSLVAIHAALVQLGVPCTDDEKSHPHDVDQVPSAHDSKSSQDSTVGDTDGPTAEGVGPATLDSADSKRSIDMLFAELV